jgi:outer membrane biosynthesis protein TonB
VVAPVVPAKLVVALVDRVPQVVDEPQETAAVGVEESADVRVPVPMPVRVHVHVRDPQPTVEASDLGVAARSVVAAPTSAGTEESRTRTSTSTSTSTSTVTSESESESAGIVAAAATGVDASLASADAEESRTRTSTVTGTGTSERESAGGSEVLPFMDGMTRPKLLSMVEPTYTREARDARVSGLFLAKCVITTTGTLHNCRVVKGLPLMDHAILNALSRWRYSPVIYQGKPVAVDYVIQVRLSGP